MVAWWTDFFLFFFFRVTKLLQVPKIEALDDFTTTVTIQLGILTFLSEIGLKFEIVDAEFAGHFAFAFYHKKLSFEETIEAVACKRKIMTSNNCHTFPKNSVVVNISNFPFKEKSLNVYDVISFLKILGK